MHLEISGRQTHKTGGLVREMDYWLASNYKNRAVLIAHSHDMANDIAKMVNPRHVKRLYYGSVFEKVNEKLRGCNDPVRYFFDEFDFCNNIDNVPVIHDGYYVTTQKRQRTLDDWERWDRDILLRLIVANDFTFTVTHGMKMFFDDNSDLRCYDQIKQMGEPQFNNEFMCSIDTCERSKSPIKFTQTFKKPSGIFPAH